MSQLSLKLLAASLLATMTIPTIAASSNAHEDAAFEGYIMALESMAPSRAKFTVMHKDYVEQKCSAKLTVSDVNSTGFQNIITALEVGEKMSNTGVEKNTLLGVVMASVMFNTSCRDFGSDFESTMNDRQIRSYPKFTQFVTTWAKINSAI